MNTPVGEVATVMLPLSYLVDQGSEAAKAFIKACHHGQQDIPAELEPELKLYNLVNPDGSIRPEVREIVVSTTDISPHLRLKPLS